MRFTYTLIFCFFTCFLSAQGWEETYDLGVYTVGKKIIPTQDGNLLILATSSTATQIVQTNLEGDSLNSILISGRVGETLLEDADENWWMTGKAGNAPFLMKMNQNGEVLFDTVFVGTGVGQTLKQGGNGWIYWAGWENQHPSTRIFYNNGQLQNWHLLENFTTNFSTHSAISDGLDFFFAISYQTVAGINAIRVVKLNSETEVIWESSHETSAACTIGVNYLQDLPNDGVILANFYQCPNWATPFIEVYKFDNEGVKTSFGGYGGWNIYTQFTGIHPVSNQEYMFCGNTQYYQNTSERYGILGQKNGQIVNTLFPDFPQEYEIGGLLPVSDSCVYLTGRHYGGLTLIKTDQFGQLNNSNYLTGQLFNDENNNCEADQTEAHLENWTVELRDETGNILNTKTSDSNGQFAFQADTGIYQITAIPPDSNWIACADPFEFEFTTFFDTTFIELSWKDTCPDFSNTFQFNTVCGNGNGEILIESTGGYGDFSYQWSNGDAGNVAQNLLAEQYFVTIEDNNCEYLDSVTISFPKTYVTDWMKMYGGNRNDYLSDALLLEDESVILLGNTNSTDGDIDSGFGYQDAWLLKIDTYGEIIWENTFGNFSHDVSTSILKTDDGSYIFTGSTINDNDNDNGADVWLVKTDANGQQIWSQTYGGTNYERGESIIQTMDGNYVIVGYSESSNGDVSQNLGNEDWWIIKVDIQGNLLWERSFGGSSGDKATAIAETATGELVITGHYGNDQTVIKLTEDGILIWKNELPVATQRGIEIIALPNGNVVTQDSYGWMYQFAGDGSIIWAVDQGVGTFSSLTSAGDGGFYLGRSLQGEDEDIPFYNFQNYWDVGFVKIDSLGQVEHDFKLIGENSESSSRILVKNNQQLLFCGTTYSENFNFKRTEHHNSSELFLTQLDRPYEKGNLLPKDTFWCVPQTQTLSINSSNFSFNSVTWEDGSTETERLVEVVADTIFSVIYETTDGCKAADNLLIVGDRLAADIDIFAPNCQLDNGEIQVSPVYGFFNENDNAAEYEVIWETEDTSSNLLNLSEGSYHFTLSDGTCFEEGVVELDIKERPEISWEITRQVGTINLNHKIKSLTQDADGNFYIKVNLFVMKFDEQGVHQWTVYSSGINDLWSLNNGNVAGIGNSTNGGSADSLFIQIFNPEGEIINEKAFSAESYERGHKVRETANGDVFLLATSNSNTGIFAENHGQSDIYIFRLNADLELLWVKNYGSSANDNAIDFTVLPNDELLIGAEVEISDFDVPPIFGQEDVWLFKIDASNGNLLWSKNYGGAENDKLVGVEFADNQVWLGMSSESTNQDLAFLENVWERADVLFSIDLEGNILEATTLSLSASAYGSESFYDLQAVDNEGVVVAYKDRIAKFDSNNELDWSIKSTANYDKIIPTRKKGYLGADIQFTSGQFPMQFYGTLHLDNFANSGFPIPIQLPADTTLCQGDSLQIIPDFYPQLTYNWSNGETGNAQIFTEPGIYELTVSTLPVCSQSDEILIDICPDFQLTEPTPTCDSTLVDAGFFGANYLWNNGDTTKTTYFHESGWAIVEMTLPNGNILIDSTLMMVIENNLTLQAEFSDSVCHQSSDGFIDLTSNFEQVDYLWNTGSTSEDLANLSAGDYQVQAIDSLGCRQELLVTIADLPALGFAAPDIDYPNCSYDSTGFIDTGGYGGSPPFFYLWGNASTEDTLGNLPVGDYAVTITDSRGCTVDRTYHLYSYYHQEIEVLDIIHPDFGQANGSILIDPTGEQAQANLSWNDGGTGIFRQNLAAGTYTVTLSDATGCTAAATIILESVNAVTEIEYSPICIFPNPFSNDFFIDFKKEENVISNLEIYNIFGQKMKLNLTENLEENSLKIETSEWSSGTYLIHYQIDSEVFIKKMVKQ